MPSNQTAKIEMELAMNNDKCGDYLTRNGILKQLSDVEVNHVSTSETAERLEDGDEYLDLEQLERGVQQACSAINPTMGRVLPRKVVHVGTWEKIVSLLAKTGCTTKHVCQHEGCCLHLLPAHVQELLKLSNDQQKQVADLEADAKAKLAIILTSEQLQQMRKMRQTTQKSEQVCVSKDIKNN